MTLLSEAVALLGRLKWGGGTERQPPTSGITPFPPTRWPGQLHPLLRGHGGHCVWRIPGGRQSPVTCPLLRESFPPPRPPPLAPARKASPR